MAQTSITFHVDEKIKNEAESFTFNAYNGFYATPESLEALAETNQLVNNPNAKSFHTTKALIEDLLSGDDDE